MAVIADTHCIQLQVFERHGSTFRCIARFGTEHRGIQRLLYTGRQHYDALEESATRAPPDDEDTTGSSSSPVQPSRDFPAQHTATPELARDETDLEVEVAQLWLVYGLRVGL